MSDFLIKPRPILSDMPDHIKQRIVNHLELMARFNARCCSKEFKRLVYNSPICYPHLIVKQRIVGMEVTCYFESYKEELNWDENEGFDDEDNGLNKLSMRFRTHRDGHWKENMRTGHQRVIPAVGVEEAAAAYFTRIVRNPKVSFERVTLMLDMDTEKRQAFLDALNSFLLTMNNKVNFKALTINNMNTEGELVGILSHLEPAILKELDTQFYDEEFEDISFHNVPEMPHWDQLKSFKSFLVKIDLPLDKWSHFEEFQAGITRLSLEIVKGIIQNFRQSPVHISCSITFNTMDLERISRYMQQFERRDGNYIVNVPRDGSQLMVHVDEMGEFAVERIGNHQG